MPETHLRVAAQLGLLATGSEAWGSLPRTAVFFLTRAAALTTPRLRGRSADGALGNNTLVSRLSTGTHTRRTHGNKCTGERRRRATPDDAASRQRPRGLTTREARWHRDRPCIGGMVGVIKPPTPSPSRSVCPPPREGLEHVPGTRVWGLFGDFGKRHGSEFKSFGDLIAVSDSELVVF